MSSETPSEGKAIQPVTVAHPSAITVQEILALIVGVTLCDLTIFRGEGHFGLAILLAVLPLLLVIGSPKRSMNSALAMMAFLLAGVALRLAWCGSWGAVVAGGACLVGFTMALAGIPPYITRGLAFTAQIVAAGHRGLSFYASRLGGRRTESQAKRPMMAVGLPIAALLVFGTMFILANPDVVRSIGTQFEQFVNLSLEWMKHFSFFEIPFCIGAAWLLVGMLRPASRESEPWEVVDDPAVPGPTPLFEAYRNTLITLIALFAAYLLFEFRTLWFREFPKGFHYSGYAHQGAGWLTAALALATGLLSLVFQRRTLTDDRVAQLRKLTWIWSVENLLLAAAVYNRLSIYVGFNGMTRMRMIGWLGITSVVVGFLLVLWKISRNHDFRWLLRRQLWTVSLAAYLYVVLPIDRWTTSFNVQRIMNGDSAPSVQLSEHPLNAEGYLMLEPLLKCPDPIIRKGIVAMLAARHRTSVMEDTRRQQAGWTARQIAEDRLHERLNALAELQGIDPGTITDDLAAFREYAYQWY